MDIKTSTDYNVDNRYRGLGDGPKAAVQGWQATDNERGKQFLQTYTARPQSTLASDRREDNRFVVSLPGWGDNYTYKNAFGSPRSPMQRRTSSLNQ